MAEQGRDLEELQWRTDESEKQIWRLSSLPAEFEIRSAKAIGITGIAEYTSAAMLFARAWDHLDADPDKTKIDAWYI